MGISPAAARTGQMPELPSCGRRGKSTVHQINC